MTATPTPGKGAAMSEWMLDAKFGIYTHWGVYSVPAFETEWYAKRMYEETSAVYRHHRVTGVSCIENGYVLKYTINAHLSGRTILQEVT